MSKFKFSVLSQSRLKNVHPDLVHVVHRALEISDIDFSVFEGLRTSKRQAEVVKSGNSQTKNSRHLTDHAVDLCPWVDGRSVDGDDPNNWKYFAELAKYMKLAAMEYHSPIDWGGDWKTLKDGYHFELSWEYYPLK